MPPDTTLSPRPSRPWYATDSGRAGVALSLVTVLVLAVGFAVIHGARSAEPSPLSAPVAGVSPVAPTAPIPAKNPEQWIVLQGSAPAPTQLPATDGAAERPSLPNMAERPGEATLERL
jgi:hypothetical protein